MWETTLGSGAFIIKVVLLPKTNTKNELSFPVVSRNQVIEIKKIVF